MGMTCSHEGSSGSPCLGGSGGGRSSASLHDFDHEKHEARKPDRVVLFLGAGDSGKSTVIKVCLSCCYVARFYGSLFVFRLLLVGCRVR